MAQENRSRFALLGMLAFQPMSGYDIKKMIDTSIAYFWNENYGHIYPMLSKLKAQGMITLQDPSKKGRAKGRPEKKTYAITPSGREELRQWLIKPHAPEYFRIEVLLKLFFGMMVPREVSLAALEREKKAAQNVLAQFKAIRTQNTGPCTEETSLYPMITLSYGEKHYKGVIEWCDETTALLKKLIARRQK